MYHLIVKVAYLYADSKYQQDDDVGDVTRVLILFHELLDAQRHHSLVREHAGEDRADDNQRRADVFLLAYRRLRSHPRLLSVYQCEKPRHLNLRRS